ncbi:membrane metallo-endopeptidase-like 1 [Centruroides vittatus]|uniref:membrane metallo-endopeptidase-like 1 n=1 Tax=Centruroides vittatus TaxID=120091 RepID=UPI00350E9359
MDCHLKAYVVLSVHGDYYISIKGTYNRFIWYIPIDRLGKKVTLSFGAMKLQLKDVRTEDSSTNFAQFILNSMDESVDPCEDFYQFSCGNWIEDHMDRNGTNVLQIVNDKMEKDFKKIFSLAKQKYLPRGVKEIIKAFDTCLNYNGLDIDKLYWIIYEAIKAGGFPLIDKTFNERLFYNWPDVYIKQFKTYFISSPLSISIYSNFLNTSENVIYISVPNSDVSSPNKEFLHTIASFFGNNKTADKDIEDILWLHNYISKISRPSSELLEDDQEYELIKINELKSIYPDIDWLFFLKNLLEDFLETGTTITGNDKVFLLGKTYIKTILELLNNGTISQRLLLNYGGSAFLTELFTYNYFEGSSLKLKHNTATNVKWSQCKRFFIQTVSPALDYLYGKYREEKFISEELIDYTMMAVKEMVNQSTWLDEPIKEAVQDKLDHMIIHVGFPSWTQDVEKIEEYFKFLPRMTKNSFENMNNLNKFSLKKLFSLYRKNNDRTKWPPYSRLAGSQVNGFYVPNFNSIVLPAGIQQLPFYHADQPKFMNFGGVGFIFAHEITHGLDNSGRLKDKYGNLNNWWNEKSETEFEKKSECFVNQYNSYHYDGLSTTVNGKKTLSENIPDNGGIRQAYLGYQKWVKDNGKENHLPGLEKYSPEQLFFISFAKSWCSSIHPPSLLAKLYAGDTHSANPFRVIGSLSNMKEFSEAFNCKPGSRMNPENKCIIW